MPPYSVLIPVYAGEEKEYLYQSIKSMYMQTVLPEEIVVVCDGPLPETLVDVLRVFENRHPESFRVLRFSVHRGLGKVLSEGVLACRNELIARMDSDDISCPERCEKQLKRFMRDPEVAVLSGHIAEFTSDPKFPSGIRKVPVSEKEILKFARKRNPMNHMAVMMRRSAVLSAGNYLPMAGAEDYFLWARMLMMGYKPANLDRILVHARVGNGMIDRRGGVSYMKNSLLLQKKFYDIGFLTKKEMLENCMVRTAAALLPAPSRKVLYKSGLRKRT